MQLGLSLCLLEDARIALRIILEQAPQLLVNGVDPPESIICCICLNEVTLMQTYASLPCNHILHFICFISEYSHRQRCPKCRKPIEISVLKIQSMRLSQAYKPWKKSSIRMKTC